MLKAMRASAYIPLSLPLLLAGCTRSASTTPSAKQSSPVGTWRWIRVDQQPVKEPFYVRYYLDGTAATWPAPEGWPATTNGVSRGRYHLEGEFLVLETGSGKDDPKTHMDIRNAEMVLVTVESNRLIYHRVVPDLEPGMFEAVRAR